MALAKEYCCSGYASVGLFGTGTTSTLRLLHCRTTVRNIDLECTLRNGLLFSAPLILPGSPGADTAEDITILTPAEADQMCQVAAHPPFLPAAVILVLYVVSPVRLSLFMRIWPHVPPVTSMAHAIFCLLLSPPSLLRIPHHLFVMRCSLSSALAFRTP
jgi:hypothetical protein